MVLRGTMVKLVPSGMSRRIFHEQPYPDEFVPIYKFIDSSTVYLNWDNMASVSDGTLLTIDSEPYCLVQMTSEIQCFVLGTAADLIQTAIKV